MGDLRLGLMPKVLLLLCAVLLLTIVGLVSFNHSNLNSFYHANRDASTQNQRYLIKKFYSVASALDVDPDAMLLHLVTHAY